MIKVVCWASFLSKVVNLESIFFEILVRKRVGIGREDAKLKK
jgi:hypothetical protein